MRDAVPHFQSINLHIAKILLVQRPIIRLLYLPGEFSDVALPFFILFYTL